MSAVLFSLGGAGEMATEARGRHQTGAWTFPSFPTSLAQARCPEYTQTLGRYVESVPHPPQEEAAGKHTHMTDATALVILQDTWPENTALPSRSSSPTLRFR